MKVAQWQSYYNDLQKSIALNLETNTEVVYGDIIYQSPIVQNIRWLVMSFKGEYNVFVEELSAGGKCDRNFGASFTWQDKAMDFALEMFLVCSGRLHRLNRRCLTVNQPW